MVIILIQKLAVRLLGHQSSLDALHFLACNWTRWRKLGKI